MVDQIVTVAVHQAFLFWIVVLIAKAAWKKQVALVILYAMPLATFETARDLTIPNLKHWWMETVLSFGAMLFTNLVLNSYLVNLLSWFVLGKAVIKARWSIGLIASYVIALFFSYVYAFQAVGLRDTLSASDTHRFVDAFYFVVMTFTTVGYGDMIPANQSGRMFASMAAINGYLIMALLISYVIPQVLSRYYNVVDQAKDNL